MNYKSSIFLFILCTLWENRVYPISGVAKGSHVGGCCEAAAYGIRIWSPWIWGILDFRSIRVLIYSVTP